MYNETGLSMPEVCLLTLWTRAEKWSREDEGELLYDCMKDPASKAHYLEQAEKWDRLQACPATAEGGPGGDARL